MFTVTIDRALIQDLDVIYTVNAAESTADTIPTISLRWRTVTIPAGDTSAEISVTTVR